MRGDQYVNSNRVISEYLWGGKLEADIEYKDQRSITVYAGDHSITTSRGDDWTMIATIREPIAPRQEKD